MSVTAEPQTYPDSYYAGAYWGPRKESPEECARRAMVFLNSLAACDPLLAHWNKIPKPRGRGRKAPLMPPELPFLTEAFRKGFNREPGGPPIEHLGLRVSAYNDGTRGSRAYVSMHCGSWSQFPTSNSCILDLPSEGPDAERIFSAPVLTDIVKSMVRAWEPDWAVALSRTHQDLDKEETWRTHIWPGWVTYVAHHRGTVPPLPAPIRIEPVEDRGTLILLTPERFTVDNPGHVALALRVRELLDRAALLRHPPI